MKHNVTDVRTGDSKNRRVQFCANLLPRDTTRVEHVEIALPTQTGPSFGHHLFHNRLVQWTLVLPSEPAPPSLKLAMIVSRESLIRWCTVQEAP